MDTYIILVVNPGQEPMVQHIGEDYHEIQRILHGYMEHFLRDEHVDFLCNDSGRIDGMPFNRFVQATDGHLFDIYGPIVLIGNDTNGRNEGGSESLTTHDIERWTQRLSLDYTLQLLLDYSNHKSF